MDSRGIIKNIEDFFRTADEKTLARVNEAFSVEIDGDISIEDYLASFGGEYFYSQENESNPAVASRRVAMERPTSTRRPTSTP